MTQNLQALINDTAGPLSGDLQPLASNDTYRTAVDAELAALDRAANAATLLNAKDENLRATVQLFAGSIRALRAISKQYPEAANYVAEAVRQVQLSMSVVRNNPLPLTPTTPAKPGATNTPGVINVTGTTPAPQPTYPTR